MESSTFDSIGIAILIIKAIFDILKQRFGGK